MSFLTSACMTELEAVNLMLGSIGESAVASLGDPLNSDALTAISCLSTSNRTVQSIGWFFNERFETWPRTVDGEIIVVVRRFRDALQVRARPLVPLSRHSHARAAALRSAQHVLRQHFRGARQVGPHGRVHQATVNGPDHRLCAEPPQRGLEAAPCSAPSDTA
jgi:hypothetical protein